MSKLNDYSDETNREFEEAMFQNFQFVYAFANKYKENIGSVFSENEVRLRTDFIKGLWYRSYYWLEIIDKLRLTNFQAFACANRGLLEIVVDLALLHNDKSNTSALKLDSWSQSQKFKAAEGITKSFERKSLEIPQTYEMFSDFIDGNKSSVENARKTYWKTDKKPNGRHPERWTGSETLLTDVVKADEILGNTIVEILDETLEQYYETQYRQMNWFIHSGISSFQNKLEEDFSLDCAFFLKGCADLGLLSTHIVLKDFKLDEYIPNYYQTLKELNHKRLFST